MLDRELYLPREWTDDPARRREAQVPEEVTFQTKPQLAQQLLARAFEAGVPAQWVTGDTIYGGDRALRSWLETQHRAFVLAVPKNEVLEFGAEPMRADAIASLIPCADWQRLSAGEGAKGPRWYDWDRLLLAHANPSEGWTHWLLVRRSIADGERAFYVVFAPRLTSLPKLVAVAGQRWTIEECFEFAKDELGLDEYEVRYWQGWYRHITLVMLAQAYVNVSRLNAQATEDEKKHPFRGVANSTCFR